MSHHKRLVLSRRDLLRYGGLTAAAVASAGLGPRLIGTLVEPIGARGADRDPDLKLVGTDGWISLPPTPTINSPAYGLVHPDTYAPDGRTTYIFGFANATGLTNQDQYNLKSNAQHSAPLFWVRQGHEFRLQLTNVGLAQRPDLFDAHTVHWHGFKNVIPFFDGEPTGSVSVPQGETFTYIYMSHDPGTYMFHCHVEDVEHVHMGMTGLVFVKPVQNELPDGTLLGSHTHHTGDQYAYNDGDGSTRYDREYAMFLSEVWAEAHWADAHIQLPEWSDYHADFAMLNGRVYPDTLEPNGSIDPFNVARNGYDLVAPAGRPDLGNQPISSLVTCKAGEQVLLRFSNLGFKEAAITLTGIKLRVIGRDATLMRGRDGFGTAFDTNDVHLGAGESFDAIFTAPAFSGGSGSSGLGYDTYVLYNRSYARVDNLSDGGGGGQRTEVHVYPAGSTDIGPQAYPNDWGMA